MPRLFLVPNSVPHSGYHTEEDSGEEFAEEETDVINALEDIMADALNAEDSDE